MYSLSSHNTRSGTVKQIYFVPKEKMVVEVELCGQTTVPKLRHHLVGLKLSACMTLKLAIAVTQTATGAFLSATRQKPGCY